MELRSGRVTSPTDDPPPPQGAAFASPALVNTPPPLPEQGGLSLDPDPASSSATSGVPPPPVVGGAQFFLPPVILRVLPLPGSPAPVGFIYDAAPDPVDGGLVAAASAFFSHQGHQVFHDPCPDLGRYCTSMGISPSSVLSVDRLPDYLLNSGLEILAGLTAPSPTAATLEGTAFLSAYLSPSSSGIGASSSGSGVRSLGGAPPDASSSSSGRAVGGLYDRSGPPPAPPPPYSVGQVPAPLVLDGLSGAPILGPGGSAPYPGPGGSSDPSGASPPRHSSRSVFLGAPASTLTTPVRNPYVASSRSAFVGGTVPTFTTPARNPYVASSRSIHTDPGGCVGYPGLFLGWPLYKFGGRTRMGTCHRCLHRWVAPLSRRRSPLGVLAPFLRLFLPRLSVIMGAAPHRLPRRLCYLPPRPLALPHQFTTVRWPRRGLTTSRSRHPGLHFVWGHGPLLPFPSPRSASPCLLSRRPTTTIRRAMFSCSGSVRRDSRRLAPTTCS